MCTVCGAVGAHYVVQRVLDMHDVQMPRVRFMFVPLITWRTRSAPNAKQIGVWGVFHLNPLPRRPCAAFLGKKPKLRI